MKDLNQIYEKSLTIAKALYLIKKEQTAKYFLLEFFDNAEAHVIFGYSEYMTIKDLTDKIHSELIFKMKE